MQAAKRPYRATDTEQRIDAGLDSIIDTVYRHEEQRGQAATLALVEGLAVRVKATATPQERRLERAVAELRRILGDDDAAATLEGLAGEIRAMQKQQGGPLGDVMKFLGEQTGGNK